MKLFRILDPFTATLITVVLLASFFPARGAFVPFFEHLTTAAIALLFFMHGAKLSREAIIAGGSHWRLHLWVMCSTFILFPLLGVLFAWWAPVNVDPMLYSGFIYLCIELTNLEPGDGVQHLMQTGWDQQTVDETKDTGTDRKSVV